MPAPIFGVRLEAFGVPIKDAIVQAAQLGFTGVALDAVGECAPDQLSATGRRHLSYVIRSHALRLLAVQFPTRHGFDHLDRLEGRIAATKRAMFLASELGCRTLIGQFGKVPETKPDAIPSHYRDALNAVSNEGLRIGVEMVADTGRDAPTAVSAFLKSLNLHALKVSFNPAHLMVQGHDPYGGVETLAEFIAAVRLSDAVRTSSTLSGFKSAPIGDGEMDWRRFFGALESIGFHGPQLIDVNAADQSPGGVAEAYAFLRSCAGF